MLWQSLQGRRVDQIAAEAHQGLILAVQIQRNRSYVETLLNSRVRHIAHAFRCSNSRGNRQHHGKGDDW